MTDVYLLTSQDLLNLGLSAGDMHEPAVYILLFLIILLECGFPPMVWLPGDSLLFLSGLYAAAGALDIGIVMGIFVFAGTAGYLVNYTCGRYAGLPFTRRWFPGMIPEEKMDQAFRFFDRWGTHAVFFGRFIPVVRTFVPFIAGIARMDLIRFTILAIISGSVWGPVICGAGYLCGSVPWLTAYRDIILLAAPAGIILTMILSLAALAMNKGRVDHPDR